MAASGRAKPPEQIIKNHTSLTHASVTVSPRALNLAHLAGVASRERWVSWSYAEARPDASSEVLLRVVRTVRSGLDKAVVRESTLLDMVRANSFGGSPKASGIVAARAALEEMREVLDINTIVRQQRCQKCCRSFLETIAAGRLAEVEGTEMLIDEMGSLHVYKADDYDAEVLTKRTRTLCL